MITDPKGVLLELTKYIQIIEIAKTALGRLGKGQPVDDIKDVLTKKLDVCDFTRASSLGQRTVPLHSVTSYLTNVEQLKSQLGEADGFAQSIIKQIKDAAGPFYTTEEVKGLKEMGDIELSDIWIPDMSNVKVKVYLDASKKTVIQVDWEHRQYRTATDGGGDYGPWKAFLK